MQARCQRTFDTLRRWALEYQTSCIIVEYSISTDEVGVRPEVHKSNRVADWGKGTSVRVFLGARTAVCSLLVPNFEGTQVPTKR